MNEINNLSIEQTIFDAISNVMARCNVKKDLIDAGNAGKYNAFTIDSVLENIRPLLAENKLIMSIKHDLIESQYVEIESKYGKKTKHNVIVKTNIILKHISGVDIEFQAIGEASDGGDKGISKAQTDSYKKIITQMFAVSDGDDKDKEANKEDELIKGVQKKEYKTEVELINFTFIKDKIESAKTIKELEKYWQMVVNNRANFSHEHFTDLKVITRDAKLAIKGE